MFPKLTNNLVYSKTRRIVYGLSKKETNKENVLLICINWLKFPIKSLNLGYLTYLTMPRESK